MKNTLAENMLRFGAKNLTNASKQKLERLAEQGTPPVPVTRGNTPAPLKLYDKVELESSELFWIKGEKKSDAMINLQPSTDNKYYIIAGVDFTLASGGKPYQFKFKKPLTFVVGADMNKIIQSWKPLVADTLKTADVNMLMMYMNFPGGVTQSSGAGATGYQIINPDIVALSLVTAIYNAAFQFKLVVQ